MLQQQGDSTTVVAIDRDKNSQQAVKWTVDHLLVNSSRITLLHVRSRSRKFRNPDVPSCLIKSAPEFCAVYVISKGKPMTVRSAKGVVPNSAMPPRQVLMLTQGLQKLPAQEDSARNQRPENWRGGMYPASPQIDRKSFERYTDNNNKMGMRDRPLSGAQSAPQNYFLDNLEGNNRPPRHSDYRDSFSEDGGSIGRSSLDFGGDAIEFPSSSVDTPLGSSPNPDSYRDIEVEMRRLKLELKQTMDMYSTACKEAIMAKQKAKELHQWKMDEARKYEDMRNAEEAALAIAEMEKAKCKAALEAAEAAQRIAELEAQKRMSAEKKVKREQEEKKKALEALANTDTIRYRKYTIDEIEIATNHFEASLKIGEGGYGPVYKAFLDHTPVAIKVLRPDAAQGRKQFQQEVEILCSIRHPNMVLLLGACPEYGCLVYEHMDYGSLDDRLFRRGNTPTIPWSIRFKIAAEIATALLFLHQSKPEPLVHRDLKPGNILLDRNYTSKISDVGLARLVPPSVADSVTQYHMTSTAGTFCYIDPEYQQTGMLGTKSDIYSLGIMLLQIITAKSPMGLTHHVEKAIEKGQFREMLDPSVTDWPVEEALSYAKLALKCAELRRKDRPDLGTVILPELNRLRNLGYSNDGMYGGGSMGSSFSGFSSGMASSNGTSSGGHSSNASSNFSSPQHRPRSYNQQDQTGLPGQRAPWKSRAEA